MAVKGYVFALMIISLSCIFLLGLVSAEVEENVYVTFNDHNAHIKQVITFYATGGYYLPPFTYSEIFYPSQKNLQIHDKDGKVPTYKIVEINESYTIYNITIPQVGSTYSYGYDFLPSTYYLYYEYDLDNVLINYLKNYEANVYLISNDDSYTRRVYFCLPSSSGYPIDYDSRPYEEESQTYNPYKINIPELIVPKLNFTVPPLISFNTPKEPEPDFCSYGTKERVFQEVYSSTIDLANHKWSDSNSYKKIEEINGDKITISLPEGYSENHDYLKRTEETLAYLDVAGIKKQDHYWVYVVDSDDKVLTSQNEGIICYETGKCYIDNEILFEDKQFQAFNIISAYFLTSYIKTYGEELDTQNWYIQGSSNYLAYKSMDFAKLQNDKIKEFMDANISEWYGEDLLSSDIEGQIRMIENTKIFTELEEICPDHSNYVIQGLKDNDIFNQNAEEIQFNNLILALYGEFCDVKSLSEVFEKREMPFSLQNAQDYIALKKEISNSKFNFFKGKAEASLQSFLTETDSRSQKAMDSARYWKDKGTIYSILLIIIGLGIISLFIFLFIRNKNKIKHSLIRSPHNESKMKIQHNKSPRGVRIISILIYISAVILGISGLISFAEDFLTAIILIGWGAFQFYVGMSLNTGKNWARVLIIIISALGLIYSISLLASSEDTILGIVYFAINMGLIFYLSFNDKVLSFYSRN